MDLYNIRSISELNSMANIVVKDLGHYHPELVNPINFIQDLSPNQLNLSGGCTIVVTYNEEKGLVRSRCPFYPPLRIPFNWPKR